jgi:predicted aspartyl protease
MMTPYNTTYDPPAPFVTIQISPFNQSDLRLSIDCLVDTGADITLIPQHVVTELKLAPEDALVVEGFDGERQQLPLFAVDMVVENTHLAGLEVVAYATTHAILGRDILNRFRLLLDGPAQALELLGPPGF